MISTALEILKTFFTALILGSKKKPGPREHLLRLVFVEFTISAKGVITLNPSAVQMDLAFAGSSSTLL